eukprot:scaffold3758_cov255-Prasinococcus_capsulatus_cf.AAC.1
MFEGAMLIGEWGESLDAGRDGDFLPCYRPRKDILVPPHAIAPAYVEALVQTHPKGELCT